MFCAAVRDCSDMFTIFSMNESMCTVIILNPHLSVSFKIPGKTKQCASTQMKRQIDIDEKCIGECLPLYRKV